MSLRFSQSDVVEAAVQMERNGLAFYTAAADAVADGRAKDLLRQLAHDEIQHLRFFEQLLRSVGLARMHETYPGEYEAYLKAHVDGQVFTRTRLQQLLAQKTMVERDALQFGVDAEKDAIEYYSEMIRYVPASDRKTIEGIIEEERRHLAQLTGLMPRAG